MDNEENSENILNNSQAYDSPPKKQPNKKVIAIAIVLAIIVASVSWALINNSDSGPIDSNDLEFYNKYPTTPEDLRYVKIESSTILWGNYIHEYALNTNLLTVRVSPTIQNLSDSFKKSYPDDIVQQAKAAYDYVAEEINPIENLGYESPYPVTILTTKEGICSDYASLLASLLYAGGLKEVAIVYTAGEIDEVIYTHAYVAVKLPSYTPPSNGVHDKIQSYLGEDWIGLDPTGGYYKFAELYQEYELHWNITTIVGVPIYGAVFSLDLDDNNWQLNHDDELGYYIDVECELYAFEHDLDDDVTFTFELRKDDVVIDREVINVTCGQDSLTEVEFVLRYLDDFSVDDYNDYLEIYLIITP